MTFQIRKLSDVPRHFETSVNGKKINFADASRNGTVSGYRKSTVPPEAIIAQISTVKNLEMQIL